jgi:hypothetical protein
MNHSVGKSFLSATIALLALSSTCISSVSAAEDLTDAKSLTDAKNLTVAKSLTDATNLTDSNNSKDSQAQCAVTCHDPHPACRESARVIDTLNRLTQLINDGNFAAMGDYFDDGVTTFNEDTKKLIIGKNAVLADIKQRYDRQHKTDGRMLSYTIDRPYAEVTGNRAVVTFVAKKVIAGLHPVDMESHSTEVFVKDGDKWKTLHYRGAWKKVSS